MSPPPHRDRCVSCKEFLQLGEADETGRCFFCSPTRFGFEYHRRSNPYLLHIRWWDQGGWLDADADTWRWMYGPEAEADLEWFPEHGWIVVQGPEPPGQIIDDLNEHPGQPYGNRQR